MEEQSEKMKAITKEKEEAVARRDDLSLKYQAVRALEMGHTGGKEARALSMSKLEALINEANCKIASLGEDFEVALVEHLSGLALSGNQK